MGGEDGRGVRVLYILQGCKRPAMAYFTFTMPHLLRVLLALLGPEVGEETLQCADLQTVSVAELDIRSSQMKN